MSTAELERVGPEQRQFAGSFEHVATDRGSWLAFPTGRHAEHLHTKGELTLCLAVHNCGPALDELFGDLRAVAPADAHIAIVEGGSSDWTLARCLRLAAEDERVVVYRAPAGTVAEDVLVGDALALAPTPLALLVPSRGRIAASIVTGLRAALDAAPAATAAVGGSVCPGTGLVEPWSGTGYVYGPDAAAAALAAPTSALFGRAALFRAESLHRASSRSLRATIAAACAGGDVVGVTAPLNAQPAPDEPSDADFAEGVLAAERVATHLPEPPVDLRRFTPAVEPLPMALREFRFACHVRWIGGPPDGLEELLSSYVACFAAEDPVSLLVWIDVPDPADAAELEPWLVRAVRGPDQRPLDQVPDIVAQLAPLRDEDRRSLYTTANCVVSLPAGDAGQGALEAMACGRPVAGTVAGAPGRLITSATGFPVGPDGLADTLLAAASDAAECARRGAAARLALIRSGATR